VSGQEKLVCLQLVDLILYCVILQVFKYLFTYCGIHDMGFFANCYASRLLPLT